MYARSLSCVAIIAIGLQVAGCYTDFGPIAVEPEPPITPLSVASRIQAGDKLKIIVYGEDNLSGIYDVNPGGMVSMPLIGTIKATGRTISELERYIAARYGGGKFLQEPKVTVSVVEFQPFYVLGEAEHPGQFPFKTGLDVLTAITTAGGFTYRASRTSVFLRHAGEDVWREYSLATPIPIAPGDLIRVPERYF
jgi:protein involved in polysaccharide export with SLBB domain